MKLTASIRIRAPRAIVADVLNSAEDAPKWQSDLVRMETVQGGPNQVGSLAHLHYVERGREYVMEDELLECDPDRRWRSKVSGNGMKIQVETMLTDIDKDTDLRIIWDGRPDSALGRVLFLLMRSTVRKHLHADLAKLARLVEARAGRGSTSG